MLGTKQGTGSDSGEDALCTGGSLIWLRAAAAELSADTWAVPPCLGRELYLATTRGVPRLAARGLV